MADRLALIRSVTHPDNTHTVAMHYMLTGVRHARPATNPQNAPDDFPCFGAVVNAMDARRGGREATADSGLPPAVSLNAPANQVSANNHIFPGFFGGYPGQRLQPDVRAPERQRPRLPAVPAGRCDLARLLGPSPAPRRAGRPARGTSIGWRPHQTWDGHQARAFDLLTRPAARKAFDLRQEPEAHPRRGTATPPSARAACSPADWSRPASRWSPSTGSATTPTGTRTRTTSTCSRTTLLPNIDRGFSALLEDLDGRGLLDETLVVWLGEFGRTPKINANAGRDHWAACNTVVLAGAGIPGGQVYGASDRLAAVPGTGPGPSRRPLGRRSIHLLGIDHEADASRGPTPVPGPSPGGRRSCRVV